MIEFLLAAVPFGVAFFVLEKVSRWVRNWDERRDYGMTIREMEELHEREERARIREERAIGRRER